jgi:hypothetical protein
MRQTPRERRCEAPQQLPLVIIEVAQILREQLIHLRRGNTFKGVSQVSEPAADRARGEFVAQAREALVDGSPHRCQAQKLRQTLLARGLDELVHADARKTYGVRGRRLNIGGQAKIDDQG